MRRLILLLALAVMTGCSSSDSGPTTPPQTESPTAVAAFHNHVLGDGSYDTRLDVTLGADTPVTGGVIPGGASTNIEIALTAAEQTAAIGFALSAGGAVLNPGQSYALRQDARYVFHAMGDLAATGGATAPTLIQLPAVAAPATGQVTVRFVHAAAGATGPVDITVNGAGVTALAYGSASTTVTFAARGENQDALVIVPAGQTPDGSNEIARIENQTLFTADGAYEVIIGHLPSQGFNGNINGDVRVFLHSGG